MYTIYKRHRQKFFYIFVGGAAFVAEYTTFGLLLFASVYVAQPVSFLIGSFVSFLGNRLITFLQDEGKAFKRSIAVQGVAYFTLAGINLLLSTCIVGAGVALLSVDPFIAKLFATACIIVSNFFILKLFIFSSSPDNHHQIIE